MSSSSVHPNPSEALTEPLVPPGLLQPTPAAPIGSGQPPAEVRVIPKRVGWAMGILPLVAFLLINRVEVAAAAATVFLLGYGLFLFDRATNYPKVSLVYYEWQSAWKVRQGVAGYRACNLGSLAEGGVFVVFLLFGISTSLSWGILVAVALAVGLWRMNALRQPAEFLENSLRLGSNGMAEKVRRLLAKPRTAYNLAVLVAAATFFLFLRSGRPLLPFWGGLPSWTPTAAGLAVLALGWFGGSQLGGDDPVDLERPAFFLATGALLLIILLAAIVLGRKLEWELFPGDPAWTLLVPALAVAILFVRRLVALGEWSEHPSRREQVKNYPGSAATAVIVIPPLMALWAVGVTNHALWCILLAAVALTAIAAAKLFLTLVSCANGSLPAWAVLYSGVTTHLLLVVLLTAFGNGPGLFLASIAGLVLWRLPQKIAAGALA